MKNRLILLVLAVITVFSACQRRDLSYVYTTGARIQVKVDWQLFPEKPTGMTLMFFNDSDQLTSVVTNDVDSVWVNLEAGHYRVYVFNQSTTEFGSLTFKGMNSFETPEAYVEHITSKWYTSKAGETEQIGMEPENLGIGLGEFSITDDMVEQYQQYVTRLRSRADIGEVDENGVPLPEYLVEDKTAVVLYPTNVVADLEVVAHMKGIQNLYSARAAMTGLAEGFYLTKQHPTENKVTQLLENWTKVLDENDPTKGYIELRSTISTFGLPGPYLDNEQLAVRDSLLNTFSLRFKLVDMSEMEPFDFHVGHRFRVERYEYGLGTSIGIVMAIKLVLRLEIGNEPGEEIVLPNVQPVNGNSSGFDATVDDWEEGETVDVMM